LKIYPSLDIEEGIAVKRINGRRGSGLRLGKAELVAKSFFHRGFNGLHIIDLDGAETGLPRNYNVIFQIIRMAKGKEIQVGGGIRSDEIASKYLNSGASSIVVSTAFFEGKISCCIDRLVVALDILEDQVLVHGWRRGGNLKYMEALKQVKDMGIKSILVTDVGSEGMISGINEQLIKNIRQEFKGVLQYAGGISSLSDIIKLKSLGVDVIIIGFSIYSGKLKEGELLYV